MKKVLLVSVGFVFALVLNANTSADYQLEKNEAINLFNAATTTMECWSMPGWTGDVQKSFATWQNGELVLTVPGQCSERWQCQVKLQTNGIVLNNGKTYTFSCNMNASHDISLVTVKLFDDSPLSDVSNHTLKAGNNTVTNPAFQGGAVGNGIIVFDFGYAAGGDVIRVNNITLQEGAAQPDQPVVDGYTLVWNADFTQSSLNSAAWNIEVNGDGGGNNELQYYCEKGVRNGASHWGPRWDAHYQYANAITNSYSVEDGFHTFTCIWNAERVSMYVDLDKYPDAQPYYVIDIPVSNEDNATGKYFHKANFIIFNLAVGGNFPGIYDINGVTALQNGPRSMYVDYVRIYQRGDAGELFYSAMPSDPVEGNSTGLESVSDEDGKARKRIHNGVLVIERDGQYYTIMGERIQ